MHEVGICQSIFHSLEAELTENQIRNLQEIHLKIGILSGVEPQFLKHAFEFMVEDSLFAGASLQIKTVDILAECINCRHKFKVEDFIFMCPACGQPSNNIIQGNELLIDKLIIKEEEPSHEEINE